MSFYHFSVMRYPQLKSWLYRHLFIEDQISFGTKYTYFRGLELIDMMVMDKLQK